MGKKNSADHEETLRKGSLPKGNNFKNGNKQTKHTPSHGMSDHETLRNSGRPSPEVVPVEAPQSGVQKKAFKYNLRSEQGGANPMAHPAA